MSTQFVPGYRKLLASDELATRRDQALEHLSNCDVCPWECKVDRRGPKLGVCKTGWLAKVSSYGPHLGEEKPLRGWRGSGTIFFNHCSLRCQYCQNYTISQAASCHPRAIPLARSQRGSQMGEGYEVTPEELARIMLELQSMGCHNINLVTPTHVGPQILAALQIAAEAGLRIPLVYNTGGYDALVMLQLLDGVIDIYMPDMKYGSSQIALHYSKVRNYVQINQAAVREMYRQVGDLVLDNHGIAQRGLLVRHLILPNNLAGTQTVVRFLAEEISTNTYLNLMDQYHPAYHASQFPRLNRPITSQEYQQALALARQFGLKRFDQEKRS